MIDRLLSRYEPYAPLALRIVVGVISIAHGAQKLFGAFGGHGIQGTAQFFEQIGIWPGSFWAVIVGLVEFLGGLAVLVGALTRYAAMLLAVSMLVAILRVHLSGGFFLPQGIEYPFALLGASITLFIGGAGELSIDRYLDRLFASELRKEPSGFAA